MKIVAISDTHCQVKKITLPEGDTLIHAGDLTYRGTVEEITQELDDLEEKAQNFRNIVVIDGNHDWLGQKNQDLMRKLCSDRKIIYLNDSFEVVDGVKIYGAPWQPEFC
jgi:predicted phosphodiesterase